MRRLRKLQRLLERQLFHIYKGRWASAGALFEYIDAVASDLSDQPIEPANHPQRTLLEKRCAELNQLVTNHFERQGDEMAATVRALRLERSLTNLKSAWEIRRNAPDSQKDDQKL